MENHKDIENKLEGIKKQSGFKTPDNFFNEFEENILNQTIKTKKASKSIYIYLLSAAASIVIFIGLIIFSSKSEQKEHIDELFVEQSSVIDTSEFFTEYLEDEFLYGDLEDEYLIEELNDNILEIDFSELNESTDEMFEYLMAEDIDAYDILEEDLDYFEKLLCEKC